MVEALAAKALRDSLPPEKFESFEQRIERIYWRGWTKTLEARLEREPHGDAYRLSPAAKAALNKAASVLRKEMSEWLP